MRTCNTIYPIYRAVIKRPLHSSRWRPVIIMLMMRRVQASQVNACVRELGPNDYVGSALL